MANALLPSVLGNVIAARQRLSSVRQRVGLESQGTQMRQLAPSPPTGPAFKPGAARQAVEQEPDYDAIQLPPEKQEAMLGQAREFIDQYGAQQQQLIDASRPQPQAQSRQVVKDEAVTRALSPLADFFKQNGRLPSSEELRALAASRQLEVQLGRKPTPTEVNLWLAKPPKL